MKSIELNKSEFKWYKQFGYWTNCYVDEDGYSYKWNSFDEMVAEELYITKRWSERGEDYWGFLDKDGVENKVIWK